MSNRSRKRRAPAAAPVLPAPVVPPPPDRTPSWLEWLIRGGGLAVGLVGGALLAVFGAFYTPFRIDGVLVPISLVLVVGGNLLLIWFTYTATEHKGLAFGPSMVWVALSFFAANRTREGDLVLTDQNWVGAVYLLAGCVTIGAAGYRMILPKQR
jgi:hypothetical protein